VTGPSSTPRGEHTPAPGANWETQLILHGEILIDTSGDLPRFLHRDIEPPAPENAPAPRPNRATRRALARAARRKEQPRA
jgi:hypothetical protein